MGSVCPSAADLSSGYFSVIPFSALRLPDPEAVLSVEQRAVVWFLSVLFHAEL